MNNMSKFNQAGPSEFYFNVNEKMRVLNLDGEFRTIGVKQKDSYMYEMFKGYDATDEGLKLFASDFKVWNEELKNKNRNKDIISIYYDSYRSNHGAVEITFNRLCNKSQYDYHTPITLLEKKWWDKCYNGGLTYCKKGVHQCYGYDFSSYYLYLMSLKSLLIPTSEGEEFILKEIPTVLKVGFYHVLIKCTHKNFIKIFAFSKDNVYTNYSLQFAQKYKKRFNITIELVQDNEPNAYLHESVEPASNLFGNVYKKLNDIKTLFPKNKLIKHLGSSLWGHLKQQNILRKTLKQINDENLDVGDDAESEYILHEHHYNDNSEGGYYDLINAKNPYKYNIRLMPFLMSFARNKTAQVALENINHVVRICVDNVTFDEPMSVEYENLLPESKTTGLIDWYHVNDNNLMKEKREARKERESKYYQ